MLGQEEIKRLMEKVNDYWIGQNPEVGICAWERGAYFLGNMAAYEVLKKKEYLDYTLRWADQNEWRFYDDAGYNTTIADYKICGETYLTLLEINPDRGTDEHMLKSMEYALNDEKNDYWWWIDTIYMVLPLYNRMSIKYRDNRYYEKAHRLFYNTKVERHCYDEDAHLWFRDERFLYDKAKTKNGNKVFWSRGNGWVFAGIARTLAILPKENPYYDEYLTIFRDMAEALARCIQPDGFWRTSLIEPDEYDMPETSGTAFFVLGYLIGVNSGLIDMKYYEIAWRGFEGIVNEAIDANGRIGWVQLVADCPGTVKKECSSDYAVGAFLLICRELLKNRDH